MAINVKRRNTERKKTRASTASWRADSHITGWGNEAVALMLFALTLFVAVSVLAKGLLLSVSQDSALIPGLTSLSQTLGPFGGSMGAALVDLMGWCALVPALWLGWFSWFIWHLNEAPAKTDLKTKLFPILGLIVFLVFSCSLGAVLFGSLFGGRVGQAVSEPLVRILGDAGALILIPTLLLASLSLSTRQSIGTIFKNIARFLKEFIAVTFIIAPIYILRYSWALLVTGNRLIGMLWRILTKGNGEAFREPLREKQLPLPRRRASSALEAEEELPAALLRSRVDKESAFELGMPISRGKKTPQSQADSEETVFVASEDPIEEYSHVVVTRRKISPALDEPKRGKKKEVLPDQPEPDFSGYQRPSFEILTKGDIEIHGEDDEELLQKSRQIEGKLRDFNIHGRVTEVHPGPVITLFEFEPAPGVKVGKISALQDDLAMSLRATSIRIIAPIPKKGTVGIEVPNKNRDMVRLREVIDHPDFKATDSILTVPLGKDTYGDPVFVDIAAMPHLLMAGATGTGKSVCINALLVSLLYRASPADLGLILIDPKVLELSIYEGIPHLKVPVVTVPKQAKAVLDWAAKEMDRRYRMMQKYGVRNIDGYNRIVAGEKEDEENRKKEIPVEVIELTEHEVIENGTIVPDDDPIDPEKILIVEELKALPKIVIVIDELADLMLTVGRDIEELITRLAQKARAAGIHLIVATQRPSVDVITGLIKANFPARLSFRVTSRIDSRTILDSMGAERLLGRGDMLFMQPGGSHLRRIHGAFISDAEVQRVVDAVKASASPCYDQKILELCEKALREDAEGKEGGDGDFGEDEFDPLYDKAVEMVTQKGQASTSMVQRVFRIGYNRAARIMEMMEREGVIGPMDGVKPREVLAQTNEESS